MEPLDKQADERNDPIYPENNSDENPVNNTDKQFQATCIMLEGKELVWVVVFRSFLNQVNGRSCLEKTLVLVRSGSV